MSDTFEYDGLAWDYPAIRRMTPEEHDAALPKVSKSYRRKYRLDVRASIRYKVLRAHPGCALCGATVADGARLEVDHMDGDPSHNHISNLQVLCRRCNIGKG